MLHIRMRQTAVLLLLGLTMASDHTGGADPQRAPTEFERRKDQLKQQLQSRQDQILGEQERAEKDIEQQRAKRMHDFQRQCADAKRQYDDQLAQLEREFQNRQGNDSGDQGGDHAVTPEPTPEKPSKPSEPETPTPVEPSSPKPVEPVPSSPSAEWNPATPTQAPAGSAVAIHGALSVKGNKLVDSAGEPVRLQGMALFWSQWMGKYYNAEAIKFMAEHWGVNLVRASMAADGRFQGRDSGYLFDPVGETAKVDAVVRGCVEAGVYCIIDWHTEGDSNLDAAKPFFSQMAQKYGHLPNVMFEPWNEPTHQSWDRDLKPYHEKVVGEIRKYSNNVCILGSSTWSQDCDIASKNPLKADNVAYTVHFYAATHKDWNRSKVQTALDNGCAVVCTEWGTCDASGNGALDLAETQKWMDFFEQNHISSANWAVSDKNETAAALKPGASPTGDWTDADLTRSGQWVRDYIIKSQTAAGY